jgi:hypothetical protein
MNILERADQIVNHRSEEKERMYGPFSESIEVTAKIVSLAQRKEITPQDVFMVMIALKLSREGYGHKEDNLLDAVAYIGALNNFHEQQRKAGGNEALRPGTVPGTVAASDAGI